MAKKTPRFPFHDPARPLKARVNDLVRRLSLEEKIAQLMHEAPGIPRLGIPPYHWLSECLHGVARAGVATVFPQAIGMAASWNAGLLKRVATAVSDEARAKHHECVRQGDRGMFKGLTYMTPNINIFRDPRWGRGHETYGEDPYLTGRMGVAFVQGLQGDDPKYLKLVATPKHYAVHSGPEGQRHTFDACASPKDLRETYLPAFKACVTEAGAGSIMGAYNRTNGEPCCASPTLLQKILRDEWGFDGFVVSDWGAVPDIHRHHMLTRDAAESCAAAVIHGCDLELGDSYGALADAVRRGLITERQIDVALKRAFAARFKLGMFDPPEMVKYARIPFEVNDCEEHHQLARQMAQESIVLLKNTGGLLPLRKDLKTIAVIGPNADSLDVLLGNYNGIPSRHVTAVEGIRRAVGPGTRVWYSAGSDLTDKGVFPFVGGKDRLVSEAVAIAQRAEVAVLCLGISPKMEGEEGEPGGETDMSGDRRTIGLPECQQRLLKAVLATGTPVVVVLFGGGAIAAPGIQKHVAAVLHAWYPGAEGGSALADVLFGDYNPAGRMPITVPESDAHLPPFADYRMQGRTYRYIEHEPLYPFGFGLSYTSFRYSRLTLGARSVRAGAPLRVSARVENTGDRAGDEVVQLYLSHLGAPVPVPVRELRGFRRIRLEPGEAQTVSFTLRARDMAFVDLDGRCQLAPGNIRVSIGGSQPDRRSRALGAARPAGAVFRIEGKPREVPY